MNIVSFLILILSIFYSQISIADLFADADVLVKSGDYKLAVEKYKQLANNGNKEAFLQLGKLYFDHGNSEGITITEEEGISYLKKAADASIAEAFYMLGIINQNRGKPPEEVFNYYIQGARLNDANAQEAVARAYWNGDGVEKDWKKSFEWSLRGAKNGNSMSITSIKSAYARGLVGVVEANDEKLLYWIQKSIENGDNRDIYCLASRYELGVGVKKDLDKAIQLYSTFKDDEMSYTMDVNLAIASIYLEKNKSSNKRNLAKKYFDLSRVDKNISENEKLISHYSELNLNALLECESAEKAKKNFENILIEKLATLGDSFAQYQLAFSLEETNPSKALSLYREAAKKSDESAIKRLGELYEKGTLVPKNEETSKYWYRKYIEIAPVTDIVVRGQSFYFNHDNDNALFWLENYRTTDNPEAQYILGDIYLQDKRSKYRAIEPLKFAAEKGHQYAQYTLATLYFNGDGVVKNLQVAFDLYLKAAEQGNSFAQLMISKFYYDGLIYSSDKEKSYFWILLSAANKNSDAKKLIELVEKQIPKQKVLEIQQSAFIWKPVIQYHFDPFDKKL